MIRYYVSAGLGEKEEEIRSKITGWNILLSEGAAKKGWVRFSRISDTDNMKTTPRSCEPKPIAIGDGW